MLIRKTATPEPFNGEVPRFVVPSRNATCPVGIPPSELMFAVNMMVEPGVASAGAIRVDVVAIPVTCSGILSLRGRKMRSPLYCAVMAWIPASAKIASKLAEPLTNGTDPRRVEPSRNVTVPVGDPVLPGPGATLAVIVAFVLTAVFGTEIRIVRLVTQDELLAALWPETYVNPEVIKKYILGIRKALGDPRDKPEFIETFPRRGYQFVAPVTELISGAPLGECINGAGKMVGREGAMAQLDGYLDQSQNSQRQVAFITGEAGIGKTTLVDAFHQSVANRSNLRIIRGQCVEGFGGKEAYYPVLEAIGQWVREA